MNKAEQWAKTMQAARLARPTFETTVMDADGKQNAGVKEVAFVVAYEGDARLQMRRGGILSKESARALARFIDDTFGVEDVAF